MRRRKCKVYCPIFFVILFICLLVYFFCFSIKREIPLEECLLGKTKEGIRSIFDLTVWHEYLLVEKILSSNINNPTWCDVPHQYLHLANGICQMYLKRDCPRLPCHIIYSSLSQTKDIHCFNDGRISSKNNSNAHLLCRKGYSLDLFNQEEYSPSIIVDGFHPFSREFYLNILNVAYRTCTSRWGIIFNFESKSNYPWIGDQQMMNLFDLKFGYDRSLFDFVPYPWLFNYIHLIENRTIRLTIDQVVKSKKMIHSSSIYWPNEEKDSFTNLSHVRSSIFWMNSNCQTKSKRTEYLNELMKHISIDNYGTCGKNILPLPNHIILAQQSFKKDLKNRASYHWERGKLELAKDYLFVIAYENSPDHDYITEKLWHALISGAIPIYYGAPNVLQWLPCENNNCIIHLRDFRTPREAATFIQNIATNKTLYLSYHQWRKEKVSTKFENMLNYFQRLKNYSFDCILCHMSDRAHYGIDAKTVKHNLSHLIGHF